MKKILKYGCFSFLLISLLVTISGILLLWLSYDTGTNITPIQKEIFAKQNIKVLDLQKNSNIQIAQINRVDSCSINIIAFHDVYRDSLIQINEVSEEGHVNKILLKNNSDKYVFIMDGDIILGAKQNRVFNTSMLIGPNKEYYLSVSCIEKNRWQKSSSSFRPANFLSHKSLRKKKIDSYYNRGSYSQKEVWDEVGNLNRRYKQRSKTSSHTILYESKKHLVDNLKNKFEMNPNANGLAYFINGDLQGIEMFYNDSIYKSYYLPLVSSICLEGILNSDKNYNNLNKNEVVKIIDQTFYHNNSNSKNIKSYDGQILGAELKLSDSIMSTNTLIFQNEQIHQSIIIQD
jgi:hypothetical protein